MSAVVGAGLILLALVIVPVAFVCGCVALGNWLGRRSA